MQAKRPDGTASSWRFPSRILLFSFLLALFIPGAPSVAAAKATLAVKLPKVSGATPVLISMKAVEAETGRLLAVLSLKKQSSQVQLKVDAVSQIVFADLFTSADDRVSGHSHVLRPVDRKKMNVTLQIESEPLVAFPEIAENTLSRSASPPTCRLMVIVDQPWPLQQGPPALHRG